MKKIISLLILVCMLISLVPTFVSAAAAGTTFTAGDFTYKVNTDTTTVTLTAIAATKLTGAVTVPATVSDGTSTYTVTHLGDAFKNQGTKTNEMTSLVLPDTMTKFTGTATFYACTGLASIHLPANLTGDGNTAVANCLTKTFYYCTNLKSVTLPAGITKCWGTFASGSGVRTVTITGTAQVDFYQSSGTAEARAWADNIGAVTVYYPEGGTAPYRITGYGVRGTATALASTFTSGDFTYTVNADGETVTLTAIAAEKLTGEVIVPEAVTSGLTYTVTQLGDAFKNQGAKTVEMTSLVLPDTITKFTGTATFYACKGLTEIHLPKGLTGRLTNTFYYCTKLETVTLPAKITDCYGTFRNSAVRTVNITGTNAVDFYAGATGDLNARAWLDGTSGITIYYPKNGTEPKRTSANGSFTAIVETYGKGYDSFTISERDVEFSDSRVTVKATLKNNGHIGTVNAICAIYEMLDDDGVKILHGISVKECTIPVGGQKEIVFDLKCKYKENLVYTIFVFDEELCPYARAVSLPLEYTEESVSNNAQVHVYENFGADSLWDRTGDGLAGSKYAGLINVGLSDTKTNAPAEAYRSFTEIQDHKITVEYDFSMESHINGAAFRLLDGQDSVFGLITEQGKLYLEQPNGEKLYLMEFFPSLDKNISGYYVKAEMDFSKKKITSLRINGEIVAKDKPFATDTNSVDGFDIYTPFEATGNVLNRMLKIYSNYEVNEIFYDGRGASPEDWTYETDGGSTARYTTNSRMPDRYSMKFNTQIGSVSAVKTFGYSAGNLVFEAMVLQPKKRTGVSLSLNEEDDSLFEIVSDGEYYYFVSGNKKTTLYNYMENVWYGFKVEFDTLNSRADVYVNNKLVLNDVDINNRINYINNIKISAAKNSDCLIFDDVKLYHKKVIPDDYVEEPIVPTVEKSFVIGMQMCNLWTPGQYNKGWDYIKSAPDRMPILGAYDEGNPEVNDWEIKWLVEHGIDYQAICTYPNLHYSETEAAGPYKPNNVREGDSLYEGYMNAEYSDKMKFSIIYENNTITGGESYYDEFFNYTVPYWIEYYFKDDRYLKIDGRPIISIYVMDNFLKMFGTMGTEDDKINEGIAKFRQMCIDAGVGNPYIINHGTGCYEHNFANYSAYDIDSIGLYGWPKNSPVARQKNIINSEIGWSNTYGLDFVPSVMPRQDLSAWDSETGFKAEKEDLTGILEWLKSDVAGKMTSKKGISKNLMLLQSWNEYGEGHYMMPTVSDGFTYLDAVREVFVGNSSHSDDHPTESQKSRVNQMVDQDRNVTVIRENPLPEIPSDSYVKKGWYFTNSADVADWVAVSENTTLSSASGKLVVTPGVNEPIIGLDDIPDCDLYDVTYIKIRMKNNISSAGGVVFFTTDSEGTFDNNKRVYFASPQSKLSTYTDYYVPVGQNVRWKGKLTGLRIEPGNIWNKGVGNEFRIESIELIADKQLTNGVKIVRNGTTVATQNSPAYRNGQLMVPLQDVAKQAGLQVNWLGGSDSYIVTNSSGGVWFKCGDTSCLKLNGTTTTSAYSVDQATFTESEDINDTVYVSVKLFKDIFGITVTYDESSKTIKIQ